MKKILLSIFVILIATLAFFVIKNNFFQNDNSKLLKKYSLKGEELDELNNFKNKLSEVEFISIKNKI